jgi:hypothetical protein
VKKLTVLLGVLGMCCAQAATISPAYSTWYTVTDLGPIPGLPNQAGGMAFLAGDANTLLVAANSQFSSGLIDSIGVVRDAAGHITGFTGSAATVASAPYIGDSLVYGPGGILFYTDQFDHAIGEIKPGSTSPDKLATFPFSVALGEGGVGFAPAGFAGSGSLIVSNAHGQFCAPTMTADGLGTYDVATCTAGETIGGSAAGFAWVPLGSPGFLSPAMLVAGSSGSAVIGVFLLDANGLPVPSSDRLVTLEVGPLGGTFDPLTNDFFFVKNNGTLWDVLEVQGFAAPEQPGSVPEPGTLALSGACALLLFAKSKRSRGC